ncbi:HEPN domain-containing protein [Thermoanaerobacterium sp. DL9XJH110]|uniref:HEPN domain-containing protein n=1 Tax=Thermoanaerobacterium sp. DL9XJH110 TaxID=3386643 RepID=UPI003BB51F4C
MKQNKWVNFFLDDIKAANIMLREELYNHTCFFAHQATEKALKGFLEENKVNPPKEHDLIDLTKRCQKIDNNFSNILSKVDFLNQFYIPSRYPTAFIGSSSSGMPSKNQAEKALGYAKEITDYCLNAIRQKAAEKEEKQEIHNENRQVKKKDIDRGFDR